jgi:hypothetical protein
MKEYFYYDNYGGLSEWVCENMRIPIEFSPVFRVINFIAVYYYVSHIGDGLEAFAIFTIYIFNAYFIERLRQERFDDADKRMASVPIMNKQIQTVNTEGEISYTYEIYLEHPSDKQIFHIPVNHCIYDSLAVGEELAVEYSPRYARQCYVFTNIKNEEN